MINVLVEYHNDCSMSAKGLLEADV